jgi:membrane protein YdbS with pleckstrin-like domain
MFIAGLQLLFIGLKLTGYIQWPWFWVLSPIWISVLLGFVTFVVCMVVICWAAPRHRRR